MTWPSGRGDRLPPENRDRHKERMKELAPGSIPLRERRSLAEEWADFEAAVIPATASSAQRLDMMRAFYGGALVFFNLQNEGYDPDHEPTVLDVAYLESLRQELLTFKRRYVDPHSEQLEADLDDDKDEEDD